MSNVFLNNNSKLRSGENEIKVIFFFISQKSLTPNDQNVALSNLVNTLTKESNERDAFKPLKQRKSISNKELTETTASGFNFNSLNSSLTSFKSTSGDSETTDKDSRDANAIRNSDPNMIVYTSSHNINKHIQVYGCRSRAGNQIDGTRKTNQDSFLDKIRIFENDDFTAFGVYDGHGTICFFIFG